MVKESLDCLEVAGLLGAISASDAMVKRQCKDSRH